MYRVYVPDPNAHIGAILRHLCEDHMDELRNTPKVETDSLIVMVTLSRIDQKPLKPAFIKNYNGGLASVIRDQDDGAMSDDEWRKHLQGKGKKIRQAQALSDAEYEGRLIASDLFSDAPTQTMPE